MLPAIRFHIDIGPSRCAETISQSFGLDSRTWLIYYISHEKWKFLLHSRVDGRCDCTNNKFAKKKLLQNTQFTFFTGIPCSCCLSKATLQNEQHKILSIFFKFQLQCILRIIVRAVVRFSNFFVISFIKIIFFCYCSSC